MKTNEWGKRVAGCNLCLHANKEKMMCYTESSDCAKSYKLNKSDFKGECSCDFFHAK